MLTFLKSAVDDASADQRPKIVAIYALLLAANAAVWTWAVIAFAGRPTLLGTAFLAYVLGLRHAVDADHIAAIDNVVRKLMQEGKRPVSVGLFFSLGHSLVVSISVAVIVGAGLRAGRPAASVQGDRQHHRHRRLGVLPARHRRDQSGHPARGVAQFPPRAPRRSGRRP